MLQQTGVQTVIAYYRRFLQKFPTVETLARAPTDDVLKVWEGLGYYARARNLHRGAKYIVEERRGSFPLTYQEWRQVPGVGPATAAALASYMFAECRPVVDGNVRRVVSRIYKVGRETAKTSAQRKVYSRARSLVTARDPGLLNQALMELGATVCRPRSPRCDLCPVSRDCAAFAEGRPESYPGRGRKPEARPVRVVAAIIKRNGRILITRRPDEGLLGGLWEFPGGKIEAGESPEEALARELREELGLIARVGNEMMRASHRYTHLKVDLMFFSARVLSGAVKPGPGCAGWRWVKPERLADFAFPAADKAMVRRLVGRPEEP
jgi:A/G-specific adenine glycosylase